MKYIVILLLAVVLFVVAVTLGTHNNQVVAFNYLVARGEFRLSTLLSILFATGFVLGWVICGLFYLRLRFSLLRARRRIKRLEQQLIQPAAEPTSSLSLEKVGKEP